jgi:hypothetical protein
MPDQPAPADARPLKRHRWAIALGVVVALAVPTALQTMPPPSQLSHQVAPNNGDPLFVTWAVGWEAHALTHHPSTVFAGNIFYPRRDAIAWSDSMLVAVPVFEVIDGAARLVGVGGGGSSSHRILAYNLLTLLGFLGVGLATYLLAVEVIGDRRAAFVSATVLSLSMARSVSVGHTQLSGFLFVPLALVALLRFLDRRRWPMAVAFGAAAAATWMMTAYYAILLALVVVPFLVVWVLQRRGQVGPRFWSGLVIAGAVAVVLSGPTLLPYWRLQRAGLFTRSAAGQKGVSLADFGRLPPSPLYRLVAGVGHVTRYDRGGLYPGLVLSGLVAFAAAWALLDRRSGRRQVDDDQPPGHPGPGWPLFAGSLLPLALIFGHSSGALSLPFDAVRAVVPGVASLRDLNRFWIFPLLGLALVAGVGARRLLAACPSRWRVPAFVVLIALAWAELVFRPPLAPADLSAAATTSNQVLQTLPAGPVLELPEPIGPTLPYVDAARELRSLVDGDQRVDGYSGNVPNQVEEVAYLASREPVTDLVPMVQSYGVRYLVLHGTPLACSAGYSPPELFSLAALLSVTPGVQRVLPAGSDVVVVLAPAPINRQVPPGPPGPIRSPVCR